MGNRFGNFKIGVEVKIWDCIRSDILSLTRIYHADLISPRLSSISYTFYTCALFAKHKYIIGNTCAQIFTYGEGFVYIHPMQYKSQSGEVFNVVIRDIGVLNALISDNSGE